MAIRVPPRYGFGVDTFYDPELATWPHRTESTAVNDRNIGLDALK